MHISLRPAAPGDAEALLSRGLRPSDEREAWKVAGVPPGPALRLTLAGSDMAGSIFADGEIVAMFGVCGPPPLLMAAFLNAPARCRSAQNSDDFSRAVDRDAGMLFAALFGRSNAPAGPIGPWSDEAGRTGSPAGIFPAEERKKTAAAPWLLAHADFERRETAICMGRLSRRFIEHWLTVFGRLENYADPEHEKSLQYLRWLGFNFDWEQPVRGPLGHELVRFWR